MIKDDLEKQAIEDFEEIKGKAIWVEHICGYQGDRDCEIFLDNPALVRVVDAPGEDLLHWLYGWLDPHWNLELLKPHPELEGVISLWMYGTSYSAAGEQPEPAKYTPAETNDIFTPKILNQDHVIIRIPQSPAILIDHEDNRIPCLAEAVCTQRITPIFSVGAPRDPAYSVKGIKDVSGIVYNTGYEITPSEDHPFDLYFIFQKGEPPRKVEACRATSTALGRVSFLAGRIVELGEKR